MPSVTFFTDFDTFFNTSKTLFLQAQLVHEEPIIARTIPYILIPHYDILLFSPNSGSAIHLQTEYCVSCF
jgi:hypothetical protein